MTTTDLPGTTERWRFAGQRLSTKNQTFYVWIDPSGEELWYDKLKATVIGALYSIQVERDGDSTRVYTKTLQYVGEREPNLEWEAADAAARTRAGLLKLERKEQQTSELAVAMGTLRELAAKQRTRADRAAFIAYVTQELSSAW